MKKKAILIFLPLISMINTSVCEESNTTQTEAEIDDTNSSAVIQYNVSNEALLKKATFDRKINITVEENKHIVLQYFSRGRKQRGQVIFLHAEGESPVNTRLVQPLTSQLMDLGWTIYLPNIAVEDYPKPQKAETDKKKDTATSPNSEKSANTEISYFKDHVAYQKYYSQLCQAVLKQIETNKQPTIIVANQNSAYWSIDCLTETDLVSAVVFLSPSLPELSKNDLDEKFSKQSLPLFSFKTNHQTSDPFRKAFNKGNWQSSFHRFNIGMLPNVRLNIEDHSIARTVTGWLEKQANK